MCVDQTKPHALGVERCGHVLWQTWRAAGPRHAERLLRRRRLLGQQAPACLEQEALSVVSVVAACAMAHAHGVAAQVNQAKPLNQLN